MHYIPIDELCRRNDTREKKINTKLLYKTPPKERKVLVASMSSLKQRLNLYTYGMASGPACTVLRGPGASARPSRTTATESLRDALALAFAVRGLVFLLVEVGAAPGMSELPSEIVAPASGTNGTFTRDDDDGDFGAGAERGRDWAVALCRDCAFAATPTVYSRRAAIEVP